MKKVFTILAFALMTISAAFAQENNNRDENGNIVRGSYLTNGFGDNWFINLGAGANFTVAKETKNSFGGLAIDANIGKWFTPSVGARFGYRGIKNSFDLKDGYTTSIDKGNGEFKSFHYVHGDFMWNISNALSGYKETRFWDVIPYASAGWVGLKDPSYAQKKGNDEMDDEWGVGAGLLNKFRLGDRLGLFIDLSVLSIRHQCLGISSSKSDDNIFAWMPTAVAGLTFNLGRTNWDRYNSVAPKPVVLPFTEADYKALQNKLNELDAKNKALADELESERNKEPETIIVTEGKKQVVLFFDLAKATLTASELANLDAFASTLSADAKLKVTGSADSGTGNKQINTKLATSRAKLVVDILVNKYGLSRDNISVDHTFDLFGNSPQSRVTVVE